VSKLFLYDLASVTKETLRVMARKKYTCTPLTDDPKEFWKQLESLTEGSTFVLLSHGDKKGPLEVKGTSGKDIDLAKFAERVFKKKLTLYLLSCHTGNDPCAQALTKGSVTFVAPIGAAVFQTTGDETVSVYSKEDSKFPGWAGTLAPNRANKAISLP
jgi:hypothetical protein